MLSGLHRRDRNGEGRIESPERLTMRGTFGTLKHLSLYEEAANTNLVGGASADDRALSCRARRLDGQVAGMGHVVRKHRRRETVSGPSRSFDRLLNVHAEVDHVHERLDGPLNLIVTAGAASDQPGLAVLDHQRALQRAPRALAWLK